MRERQPIGLDQPNNTGTNYPLVNPSDDIKYLLGDFFLSFENSNGAISYPLRIAWMYGFGDNVVPAPIGWNAPTHSKDLVVVDAEDNIVFDSTTASKFTSTAWDGRLLILEWTTADKVCRCTMHTAWSAQDIADGQTKVYDLYIEPINGELQSDTWYELPKRITSITVGSTVISKKQILTVEAGYNMNVTKSENDLVLSNLIPGIVNTDVIAGSRKTNRILLEAIPGAGLGVFPGCVDSEVVVRTINKQRANTYQNFTLDGEACVRLQRAVGLTATTPRTFDYAAFSLSSSEAKASLEFHNDCKACCDCESFARTYQGLKRQWFLHKDLADFAVATRDNYDSNVARWAAEKDIREKDQIKIRLENAGDGKVSWGVNHCNASKCCIVGVQLSLVWIVWLNDSIATVFYGLPFPCIDTKIQGSAQCNGPETIVPQVVPNSWNRVYDIFWDYTDAGAVTSLYGRQCFPDAKLFPSGSYKVQLYAFVRWDGFIHNQDSTGRCNRPYTMQPSDFPAEVTLLFEELGRPLPEDAVAFKSTPVFEVKNTSSYCDTCECGDTSVG